MASSFSKYLQAMEPSPVSQDGEISV